MIANYVKDFARWASIPSARFYSHQIPAEFLFEQPGNLRLQTSASPLETAFTEVERLKKGTPAWKDAEFHEKWKPVEQRAKRVRETRGYLR